MTSNPQSLLKHHPFKGVLLAASAFLLFAGMDSCTKYLTMHYDAPVVVAIRYLVHLFLMFAILAPRHSKALVKTQRKGLVLIRGATLALLSLLMALALQRMPIAETTAICFSAPMMVVLLASLLLHERIGLIGWLAVSMGFIGVLLIVRPGSGLDPLGIVFAFLAAATGATYQLLSRVLASTEKAVAMLFYSALIGSIVFGLALPWYWDNQTPTYLEITLFLFMGISGGIGHYLFTIAYRHAPASTLAPATYSQLLWSVLLGWILFDTIPDGMGILGMTIIAMSGLMIALKSRFGRSQFSEK
jgi:drug/metabolite transporter (DMT)-like permease